MTSTSDFLVFLDESGDHSLQHIDTQFPVFALAAVIFDFDTYLDIVNPKIDRLKYKYWGHRNIIFHSIEIRKQKGAFGILRDEQKRNAFHKDLSALITELDFTVISAGVDKIRFGQRYIYPASPYDLTLEFIMERLYFYFRNTDARCSLIAESRGQPEDDSLYRSFRSLMDNGNNYRTAKDFQSCIADLKFLPKKHNENGSQVADLVAYPVARKTIGRANNYPPYRIVENKFYSNVNGNFFGYGYKSFP